MESSLSIVSTIEDWLLNTPHASDGGVSFTEALVGCLRALGLPLWRVSLSLLTKHPEVLWRTVQWNECDGVRIVERQYKTLQEVFFTQSPVALIVQGTPAVRVRLMDDTGSFPVCRDLQQQGGTDYYAQGLRFLNGQTSYISWATRDPNGFSDDVLRVFNAICPALARRLEIESAYHATRTLLDVYLGKNAARRVVDGSFRRGAGELIQAAIWFCDLRDFTPMSDQMTPHAVVAILDAYFDRVASAVAVRGGEVLKFIGDAILAIFPSDADSAAACQQALGAAKDALTGLQALNGERGHGSSLAIGVALHLGEVMYGNIGSHDRLDFTVISSSVNETCRLESLCKVLHTPLTMSEAFVSHLDGEDVIDLGRYNLKGLKEPVRVFTLERYAPPDVPDNRP